MSEALHPPAAPLWFSATFPGDPRFVDVVRDLSGKIAESLGYAAPDAAGIGRVVSEAMSRVMMLAQGNGNQDVEVRFRTSHEDLEVEVAHVTGSNDEPAFRMTKALPTRQAP